MVDYVVVLKVRTRGTNYDQEVREVANRSQCKVRSIGEGQKLDKKGYIVEKEYTLVFQCNPDSFLNRLEHFKEEWRYKVKKMGGIVYHHLSKPKLEINIPS